MRYAVLLCGILILSWHIGKPDAPSRSGVRSAVVKSKKDKTKPAKAWLLPWTRWKRDNVYIVSIPLHTVEVKQNRSRMLIRCAALKARLTNRQDRDQQMVVTTSYYVDTASRCRRPVGFTILQDGTITYPCHCIRRRIFVMPQQGRMYFTYNWRSLLAKRHHLRAIEMGPSVYPALCGGIVEKGDWRNRVTWRYALAFRGKNELLVLHGFISPRQLQQLCAKLKVKEASLLDGGSSIISGSSDHLVLRSLDRRV